MVVLVATFLTKPKQSVLVLRVYQTGTSVTCCVCVGSAGCIGLVLSPV